MSEDIYEVDPQPVQNSEIRPATQMLLTPPDALAHGLAGLTYHQGANYGGGADKAVTVVDGTQCVHDGRVYYGRETLRVPRAVADFMIRSGWATSDSARESPELASQPELTKSAAKAAAKRQVSACSGRRRSPKR
jgi:hypothetical protein